MRTRITGLVQLKTGDAVRGVVARLNWPWRYVRIDQAEAFAVENPEAGPTKVDGVVWIPKSNISYVQELLNTPALKVDVPVKVSAPVTVLTAGGAIADE